MNLEVQLVWRVYKKGDRRLSKREIASLACKILGIYIFVQGINVLSSVLSVSLTMQNQNQMGHEVIDIIVLLYNSS